MANKRVKEKRVNTAFMLEPSFIAQLDHYAEKIGISRSLLIRNCVVASLDDLNLLEIVKESLSKKKFTVQDDEKLIIDLRR